MKPTNKEIEHLIDKTEKQAEMLDPMPAESPDRYQQTKAPVHNNNNYCRFDHCDYTQERE